MRGEQGLRRQARTGGRGGLGGAWNLVTQNCHDREDEPTETETVAQLLEFVWLKTKLLPLGLHGYVTPPDVEAHKSCPGGSVGGLTLMHQLDWFHGRVMAFGVVWLTSPLPATLAAEPLRKMKAAPLHVEKFAGGVTVATR